MNNAEHGEGPRVPTRRSSTVTRSLAAVPEDNRRDFVAAIKELRSEQWQRIADHQCEHINEITGIDVSASLTAVTDSIICRLADRAFAGAGAPPDCWQSAGVFAIGGYGRGELCPYSDIDMLVLWAGSGGAPEWLRAANQELQTLMWDCGFKVGASMRGADELERLLLDDFVTATAVL
ncbi:MAG: DUF294 nucleotidyltransferase-like domain-containing protein, partial [Planctomycetota bacterium]